MLNRGPLPIIKVLEGDRYVLKSLTILTSTLMIVLGGYIIPIDVVDVLDGEIILE